MKKYKINEIFYSLQGEGQWAGRAAIFIRFSGCNLKCPFCDTNFKAYSEMSENDILSMMRSLSEDCRFVVFTGGEPTLQVDDGLVTLLKRYGYYISIETNGTNIIPDGIDWITCSPKNLFVKNGKIAIEYASEVKVVFDGEHVINDFGIEASSYYIQPCDVGDKEKNAKILEQAIIFIKQHPKWRLSLQQQKIINVR